MIDYSNYQPIPGGSLSPTEENSVGENVWNGFVAGLQSTWQGVKDQFTLNGYISTVANGATMGMYGAYGQMKGTANLISNIPNYKAKDYQFAAGFVVEKVVEYYVFKKAMPVLKSELGLPRGFGNANRFTNEFSFELKGRLGEAPFSIPTPTVSLTARTRDIGLILSRNVFTPLGYGVGMSNYSYLLNISNPH